MNTHAHKIECPYCGEIELAFSYHIREEYPGDPGDVYTVGEEWECENCHRVACFFDADPKPLQRAERRTARGMLRELSLACDRHGDAWGWGMSAWFDIAAALFNRGARIPAEWEYRPSPCGPSVECEYTAELLAEYPDAVLLRAGDILQRYTARLHAAGESY